MTSPSSASSSSLQPSRDRSSMASHHDQMQASDVEVEEGEVERAAEFACAVCRRAFRSSKAVDGHMRMHPESERPTTSSRRRRRAPTTPTQTPTEPPPAASRTTAPNRFGANADAIEPVAPQSRTFRLLGVDVVASVYRCPQCSEEFYTYEALGDHVARRCGSTSNGPSLVAAQPSSSIGPVGSTSNGGNGVHRCKECPREFETGQQLGGHMRKHYGGDLKRKNK